MEGDLPLLLSIVFSLSHRMNPQTGFWAENVYGADREDGRTRLPQINRVSARSDGMDGESIGGKGMTRSVPYQAACGAGS